MARSFYVTVRRAKRVGWLAGPFSSELEARAMVDDASRLAIELDPWAHFDAFGTASVEVKDPPRGVLNDRLGI